MEYLATFISSFFSYGENTASASSPPPPPQNYERNRQPQEPEIDAPKKINTVEEFPNVWFDWNDSFRLYVNRLNIPYDKQGILLLNLMGPAGQQIYRTFTFDDYINQSQEISILTMKFDMYAVFGKRMKQPDENIVDYVEELRKLVASKHYSWDSEPWIIKKLLQEIDKKRFTRVAYTMMPSLTGGISVLNLRQIIRIWNVYENATHSSEIKNYCNKCGMMHGEKNCTATGKQCFKCKEWNHLASTCQASFINDCHFCGTSHRAKRCPAWGKKCDICNKENHFPIRCKTINTLLCRFCNTRHIPNRSVCPAKKNVCGKCRRMGHYQVMCPEQGM